MADAASIELGDPEIKVSPVASAVLFWSGVASGVALAVLLSAAALTTRSHGRVLLLLLIAVNVLFLARCLWRRPPPVMVAVFAVARGIHWALSMALAVLALLLVFHAPTPGQALAGAGIALMLVLWAAAVRRLLLAPPPV